MNSPPRSGSAVGYPFGAPVLTLRSIPSRLDIGLDCVLDDRHGQPVGAVHPAGAGAWRRVAQFCGGGDTVSWQFQVVGADETPLLTIVRPRPRRRSDWHEFFEIRDADNRDAGYLEQNNPHNAAVPTFNLLREDTVVGHTIHAHKRIAHGAAQRTVVHDHTGRAIATITEQRTNSFVIGNDFYDYTLTFHVAPGETMGRLCVAVMFTEHFYRRTRHGGTLRGIAIW